MNRKIFGIGIEWVLGAFLALCILAFFATRWAGFSIAGFAAIVLLFLVDASPAEFSKAGIMTSLKELAVAVIIALVAWVALMVILNTASPLDVVTSCSMVPNLQRGDLIIIRNGAINAPTIKVNGSIDAALPKITVSKSPCTLTMAGQSVTQACTSAVNLGSYTQKFNPSNDIVVYEPNPAYYGLIVHRVFVRITNGTDEVYLTKGDNNLGLDQEAQISEVPRSAIQGAVVARIPLVGFLKLFLFMQFDEPQGCKLLVTGGN